MTTVWVLYEEYGQYSDYNMRVHGVFSSEELGKAAFDLYIQQEEESGSNEQSSWSFDGECWHRCGGKSYSRFEGTVSPFTLDVKRTDTEIATTIQLPLSGYAIEP